MFSGTLLYKTFNNKVWAYSLGWNVANRHLSGYVKVRFEIDGFSKDCPTDVEIEQAIQEVFTNVRPEIDYKDVHVG